MDRNSPTTSAKPIDYNKSLINENVIEYKFVQDENTNFTFEDFIGISKNQEDSTNFVKVMSTALEDSQKIFNPYFWECPPIYEDTLSNQFQFVTVKAPGLSRIKQNYSSFKEQFRGNESKIVCSFQNLGGDAIMVVPVPAEGKDFSHLARFNENADFNTKKIFWEKVAEELDTALKDNQAKWLSTNGMGVYYLHVRIDERPKYYEYKDYKSHPASSLSQVRHRETSQTAQIPFKKTKTSHLASQTHL